MRNFKLIVSLFIVFQLLGTYASAQTDTEFWFAAPEISSNSGGFDEPIFLRLSALDKTATVTISQPANSSFTPIVVQISANSTESVDLSAYLAQVECQYNELGKKGLFIESTAPITAYYDVASTICECNPEIFALKGRNALGTDFYVPFQNVTYNEPSYVPQPFAQVVIVATEDNTTVNIIPTADLQDGTLAGTTKTITLDKGETYAPVAVGYSAASHPTGTHVTSDKPIAITMSDDLLNGSPWGGCADLVGDQIVPVSQVGKEYIVQKGQLNASEPEKIFIVATKNGTTVYENGVALATGLTPGKTLTVNLTSPSVYITSSEPVYLLHLSGFGCELGAALIPSITCRGSREVAFVRSHNKSFVVNLVVKKGFESFFLLNGAVGVIDATSFSDVPGTAGKYVSASIDLSSVINVNQAYVISNSKNIFQMGMLDGYISDGSSYGFFSNFSTQSPTNYEYICKTGIVTLSPSGSTGFVWNNGATSPTVNTSVAGTYWVKSDMDGCLVTDTFVVKILDMKLPNDSTFFCTDSTTITVDNGFDTYRWSNGDTTSSVRLSTTGNHSLTVTSGSCSITDDVNYSSTCSGGITISACAGEQETISPPVTGDLYSWSDGILTRDRTITVSTYDTLTLSVVNYNTSAPNLVVNGDFANDDPATKGFTTGYSYYQTSPLLDGQYWIGNDANTVHSSFVGLGHGGSGNFMVVNGNITSKVWAQTINVKQQTTYVFSCWVSSVYASNPADIRFSINNIQLGNTFAASLVTNDWRQFFVTWNSGNATTATIEIMDLKGPGGGNDFGLDDIVFQEAATTTFPYVIRPIDCDASLSTCVNDSVLVKAIDGQGYAWSNGATTRETWLKAGSSTTNVTCTVEGYRYNLVNNGDFASTTRTFETGYIEYPRVRPDLDAQEYWIGQNSATVHSQFVGTDHTSTITGQPSNFLAVNGSGNTLLWKQTILNIKPNTDYVFSCWVQSLYSQNPAKISFKINGIQQVGTFDAGTQVAVWKQFYVVWNSGSAPQAVIEIVDTELDPSGNDFGIDDIVFAEKKNTILKFSLTPRPCEVKAYRDTSICLGDSARLQVVTDGEILSWQPASHFTNPKVDTAWVRPDTTTTYSVEAKFLLGNLVTNPGFESGDIGFFTQYLFKPRLDAWGSYFIGKNPKESLQNWTLSYTDHTSGTGNMMICDGSDVMNTIVYQTPVDIEKGKTYLFSIWVRNVHVNLQGNMPLLQFYVEGVPFGSISFPKNRDEWIPFWTEYTATKSGTIMISIKNENTVRDQNDFALDDIFFGEYREKSDSAKVTVQLPPVVDLGLDTTIWEGNPLVIDAGAGAFTYLWSTGETSQTITATRAGKYYVTVSNGACETIDSIEVFTRKGLVAYYRFCGGSLNDLSGNDYHLKIHGLPDPTVVNSIYDQGYHFEGAMDEYLTPPTLPTITEDFSVMAWVKVDNFFGNSITPIFTQGITYDEFTLWVQPTGIRIYLNWGRTEFQEFFYPTTIDKGVFYHVGATFDATAHEVKLFLDGKQVLTANYPYKVMTLNEGFIIGSSYPGGQEYFMGTIDEVRLYNKPLAESQIDSIYKIQNKTVLDLGADTSMWEGESVALNAPSGFAAYEWIDASTNLSITVNQPGDYWLKVTDTAGCWYVDTVKIRVNNIDTLRYTLCEQTSYPLRAMGGTAFLWDDNVTSDDSMVVNIANPTTRWVDVRTDSSLTRILFELVVQPCDLSTNPDTAICRGDTAYVEATSSGNLVGWVSDPPLPSPTKADRQYVSPDSSTTYHISAMFAHNNLIMNGDFELGNTGFGTDYTENQELHVGEYFVGTTPYIGGNQSWSYDFKALGGSGNMLILDGDQTVGKRAYYITLYVVKGRFYNFSTWLHNVHRDLKNPAKLRFYAGTSQLGAIDFPPNNRNWVQFSTQWIADTTGFVEVGIINQNTFGDGNDFAIDGMSFSEYATKHDSVVVTVNALPQLVMLAKPDTLCRGISTILTATGADSIAWDRNVSNGQSFIPDSTRTYQVIGVNNTGCRDTSTIDVVVHQLPNVKANTTRDTICLGDSTTLYGTGALSYVWSSPANDSLPFVPVYSGWYIVTGTDTKSCTNTDSVEVFVNALPAVYATAFDSRICMGDSTYLSGNGALSYSWSDSIANGQYFKPTSTKSYLVTGTDANGCIDTSIIKVTVDTLPVITATATPQVLCVGASTILNGRNAQTYVWDNSVTNNQVFSPDSTTTYTVTGTDANGCKDTTTITVTVNKLPVVQAVALRDTICEGDTTLLYGMGAKTYTWTNSITDSVIFRPILSSNYIVKGIDSNNCISYDTTLIVVNKLPTVSAIAFDNKICYGDSTRLIGKGAKTYSWSDNIIDTVFFKPSATLTYSVTGTDINGCKNTGVIKVTVDTLPVISAMATPPVLCSGASTKLKGFNAQTYLWSSGKMDNLSFVPDSTRTYTVTGTDINGCKDTTTVTVTVNMLPTVVAHAANDTVCKGDTTLLYGTGAKTYSWKTSSATFFDSVAFVPQSTRLYVVKGTDSNTCVNFDTIEVVVNIPPTVTARAFDDEICVGDSTYVYGLGAITYSWSNNISDSNYFKPISTVTYLVTGTDINGCTGTASQKVTVYSLPTVVASANPPAICVGDSSMISATGAVTYLWDNAKTGQYHSKPMSDSTYVVTGTDANGCKDSSLITLVVKPLPVIVTSQDTTICYGDTARIFASGTATGYAWSNNLDSGSIHNVAPTSLQLYSVTGTLDGCTSTEKILISVYPQMTMSLPADYAICLGDSTTLQVSSNFIFNNYNWDNNRSGQSIVVRPTTSTTYRVTGLHAACSLTDSITISINQLPSIVASASDTVLCRGASTRLSATGAYSYSWDSVQGGTTFIPLVSRWYTVIGKDIHMCRDTSSVYVRVKEFPTIAINGDTTICYGDTASISVQSNATSYVWTNALADSPSHKVHPLSTTTYSVTATLEGCSSDTSVKISVHPLLQMNIVGNKKICTGDTIMLHAVGNPLRFEWDNDTTNTDTAFFVLDSTRVISLVGDYMGCLISDSVVVSVSPLPDVIANASDTVICLGELVKLWGSGANTYTWSDNIPNNTNVKPTSVKEYFVTGTDVNNCVNVDTILVVVNPLPVVDAYASDTVVCFGDSVMLFNKGADSYSWYPNPVVVQQNFVPSTTTTYVLEGIDNNQCKNRDTLLISVNELPVVKATVSPGTICYGKSVVFTGHGATQYHWSDNIKDRIATFPNKPYKYYTVEGIDSNGCKNSDSVPLAVIFLNDVRGFVTDSVLCEGSQTFLYGDKTRPYSYYWSKNAQDNMPYVPASSGYYTVEGVDRDGCRGKDSVYVRVKSIPDAPVVQSKTICFDSPIPPIEAIGSDIKWFSENDTFKVLYSGNIYMPNPKITGVYKWLVNQTVEGCTSGFSTSQLRIIDQYKGLSINTADTSICEFPKHRSQYASSGTLGNIIWRVPNSYPWNYATTDSTIIEVQWNSQGVDTIILATIDEHGCEYRTSQIVSVAPYPVSSFDVFINPGNQNVTYLNRSDSSVINEVSRTLRNNYKWNFGQQGDTLQWLNRIDTTLRYQYGYYDVDLVAINEFGCSDTTSQQIFVDILTNLYVPNAFVPGHMNPELNKFRPKAFNLKLYKIWVYDTWGNLLWYSDKLINGQPLEGWDGTYGGKTMKSDSYVWKIEAEFDDNTKWHGVLKNNGKVKTFGNIVLLR